LDSPAVNSGNKFQQLHGRRCAGLSAAIVFLSRSCRNPV
jgi:hypothetical protein